MSTAIVYVGINLAKNAIALHGVDEAGKAVLVRPVVRRDQLLEAVAKLPPCAIAMEASSGAHHWARRLAKFGHTARLIAPKFVGLYRRNGRRGKNDAADAAAICEAATRPDLLFGPVKTEDQQPQLMVHRARQGFIEVRTAHINRIRGLLSQHGVVLPLTANTLRQQVAPRRVVWLVLAKLINGWSAVLHRWR